eukprot:TRINITY_DN4066_c0_g1_i2.p2 TRINITY_DN4066_c0_g1~~TRINITY_DN4066_c0_g1_i2.p2  ORF type:complete len:114 (-),score=19.42 TRINITY_DN4066_c0_g1_i2:198-539(-)
MVGAQVKVQDRLLSGRVNIVLRDSPRSRQQPCTSKVAFTAPTWMSPSAAPQLSLACRWDRLSKQEACVKQSHREKTCHSARWCSNLALHLRAKSPNHRFYPWDASFDALQLLS